MGIVRLVSPLHIPLRITQRFGENPDWYTVYHLLGHEGVDLGCPEGTPVLASHNGHAQPRWGDSTYGDHVYLYGDGYMTLYAHLSKITVWKFQKVKAGGVLGLTGSTGRSTGTHLHWGLKVNGISNLGYKDWIDPLSYIEDPSMSMRLTLHEINRIDDDAWLQGTKAQAIKIMDPDVRGVPTFAGEICGRLYFDDETDKALIAKGFQGGVEYVRDWCAPRWAKCPTVSLWELWNEPEVRDRQSRLNLADASMGAMQEAQNLGKHVVVGNISVGQPEGDIAAIRVAMSDLATMFKTAVLEGHLGGYHAYWALGLGPLNQWTAHRYEILTDALVLAGVHLPDRFWVLNEAGIDLGLVGEPGRGWKSSELSEEQYWGQIVVFGEYCEGTRLVKWFSPFTSGPTSDWADFDFDEGLRGRAVQYYQSHGWGDGEVITPLPAAGFTDLERTWAGGVAATWPATMKYAADQGRRWCSERAADNGVDVVLISYAPAGIPVGDAEGIFYRTKLDGHTWKPIAEERIA